jgi:tetratricopeptide (TPR) repeat protein
MKRKRYDLDKLEAGELVSRGIAAARVGETDEAHLYLMEATQREPDNAEAWLWLAGVESDPRAKRDCFERVLELRPDDTEARAGLDRLAEKYGQAVLQPDDDIELLHCAWHPDRETGLTCTRCGRPMCPDCARQHPVGWRCKECAKELRSPLYKVSPLQYAGALVAGSLVSTLIGIGMYLIGGMWFFALFIGAGGGTVVAEAVSVGGGRKRGRGMQIVAGAAVVLGAVAGIWIANATGLAYVSRYRGILGLVLYAVIGAVTAYRRLR